MVTIVDSLVLTLGLDASQFTRGAAQTQDAVRKQKDDLAKHGKDLESQYKEVSNIFGEASRKALGLFALLTGGKDLQQFAVNLTKAGYELGNLSRDTGKGVETLSKWQVMAKLTNNSVEGMSSNILSVSSALSKWASGLPNDQARAIIAIGRQALQLGGEEISVTESLDEVVRKLIKDLAILHDKNAGQAKVMAELAGVTGSLWNIAARGSEEVRKVSSEAERLSGWTKQASDNADRLLRIWNSIGASMDAVGAKLLGSGAATTLLDRVEEKTEAENVTRDKGFLAWIKAAFVGHDSTGKSKSTAATAAPTPSASASTGLNAHSSAAEIEAYIRQAAVARNIDPGVAVAVAKSEGLYDYVGDRGTSFGPFQLHYRSAIPGFTSSGLGDEFSRRTGLDARDRSTIKQQIDFALDEASKGGWGPWHGWRGAPFAGIGAGTAATAAAGGGAQYSPTITIGSIAVNAPQAKDAPGVARGISSALQEQLRLLQLSGQANFGSR